MARGPQEKHNESNSDLCAFGCSGIGDPLAEELTHQVRVEHRGRADQSNV
jgi:hypothetical protein